MRFTAATIASSLLLGQASAALPPIIIKGTKFYYENGTQFFIKGVAYQQDTGAAGASTGSTKFVDPLSNPSNCQRDVPLLKALNTNTIRTYAIDPTADHSACMKLLDDAGIYVISDLSEPSLSINRDTPAWNVDLYNRYTAVVDEMSKYSNVIGFFAGNEVTNQFNNTPASAFVKAAVRDTKAYIKKNVKRPMGVGYAANDDPDIRDQIAHYFNCGNQDDAIDFWGYNIYEWCGETTFEKSGYKAQVDFFSNYSVPVFFAEYGCNTQGGAANRIFQETGALYSDQMTGVISGGIVYMYFQEANDYGLVSVSGSSVSTLKDYGALKTQVAAATPSSTSMSAYTPTNSPAACPDITSKWGVKGDALPPVPDSNLCDCMFKTLSCVPSSNLSEDNYGPIFQYICGNQKTCAGIIANATTGVYGAYSMCSPKQQLGYVLDAYYQSQGNAKDACGFNGQAALVSPQAADNSCKSALASASSANSIAATATGGSGASPTGSKNFAAPIAMRNAFTLGDVAVGLYVVVAMTVGAGMVML